MEDMLLEITQTSQHCVGWRPSHVEHWLQALGQHVLFRLEMKGGIVSGRDYYLARVQHKLPTGKTATSFETYGDKNPGLAKTCDERADTLQKKHGGLYIGLRDCVRSVMCDRDGGLAELSGACRACHALTFSKSFQKRLQRREASSVDTPDASARNDSLTREELEYKSVAKSASFRQVLQNTKRRELSADFCEQEAKRRAEHALHIAQELLTECYELAEQASTAEQQGAADKEALAIAAQRIAEAAVSLQHSEAASLQAMAMASALMSERVEERQRRTLAEVEAASSHNAKRQALSAEAEARREAHEARHYAEEKLASITEEHAHAVSALHKVHLESRLTLEQQHTHECERMAAQVAQRTQHLLQRQAEAREKETEWHFEQMLRKEEERMHELEAQYTLRLAGELIVSE